MRRRRARAATAGRSARGEALEALPVLTIDLLLCCAQDFRLRYQDQIETGQDLLPAEALAQEALGAIARHRSAHLPRGRQTQPAIRPAICRGHQDEERAIEPHPLAEGLPELGAPGEPFGRAQPRPDRDLTPAQAPIRFRPFWRRLLSTRRPPLVRIRTRKPWVRFRLRLFG